jgi:23S rRNA (uracil1939-C5)-methyltransferase
LLLTIQKLIYGGDGLARLPEDSPNEASTGTRRGKAVFVPFVLATEKIEAMLTEQKSGFARATAEKIIESSPHRVQPQCPYFTRCGGCHYQHADYQHQLEIKRQILRENLQRIAKLELDREIEVHSSSSWNYRNRSRLQVQTHPNFAIGYFKTASRELLPVEECPISSPLINRGIAVLWQLGRAGKAASGVHAIELFANADDSQMLITLWCLAEARRAEVRNFAEDLKAALPEILGVTAFREAQSAAKKYAVHDRLVTVGDKQLTYQAGNVNYRVSTGAFFQTNRHLTVDLVKTVTQDQSGELALDLYAGVGLFSATLASNFRHIVSVESSDLSFPDLEHNLPSHSTAIQDSTESYLSRPRNPQRTKADTSLPIDTSGKPKVDLIVVDPPRSGLGDRVTRLLISLAAPRITYVSCDPATLARDLVSLLIAGYRVEQAHLFDLFPQTFHIESVLHLNR